MLTRTLTAALLLLLTACTTPQHGLAIDKQFIPAHSDLIPITTCRVINKITTCQTTFMTRWVNDTWRVQVRDDAGDTGWVEVTEWQYKETQIGSTRL